MEAVPGSAAGTRQDASCLWGEGQALLPRRGLYVTYAPHPGSEAFYVLAGEQSIRTPHGLIRVGVGKPDMPMQVSSSGSVDLHALVMFVVDATRPFSSPARFGALGVGDRAPDFTLPSTTGEKVSLTQFRGN